MEKREVKTLVTDHLEDVPSAIVSNPLVEIPQRTNAVLQLQPSSVIFNEPNIPNSSFDDGSFAVFKNVKKRKKKIQSKLACIQRIAPDKKEKSLVCNFEQQNRSNVEEESSLPEHINSIFVSEYEAASEQGSECPVSKSVCPLCWKQFERKENFSAHLKMCATKHNLSFKQLMDALELQTKQTEERKALGLPAVPQNVTAKKGTSRKSSVAKDGEDPDLQLGLALSVSMREAEEQKLLHEQDALMEAGLGHEIIATQATLLERFGFTSSRPVLSSMLPPSRQGKLKLKGITPLLLLRSQEERERLITEKVALILSADENSDKVDQEMRHLISELGSTMISETLHELHSKECLLWKLASVLPADDDNDLYYVQTFSNFISPSKVKAGEKLQHLSQLPYRLCSPGRQSDSTPISACINTADSPEMLTQQSSESKLRSPQDSFLKDLAHDWKRLLNKEKMSDLTVFVKEGQKIYAHELVLYARCPAILSDIQEDTSGASSLKSVLWNDVPYDSAYAFLEFIYCGKFSKILKLSSGFQSILMLADKYNLIDLQNHLRLVEKIRDRRTMKETLTKGQMLEGQLSHDTSPDNSQSLLSPNFKSPRMHKRKFEPKSDEKHNTNEDCSVSMPCVTLSRSSSKCPSPDPFSDTNMELSEEINTSTQQDMDHLMSLLGSSTCNRKSSQGVLYSESCQEEPSSPVLKITSPNLDSPKTLLKEKRKYIEDTNNVEQDDSFMLKRICVESKHSVRNSLLEKFKEVATSSQQEDPLMIDLTQNSGRSSVKTSTPSSSQNSQSSKDNNDIYICKRTSPKDSSNETLPGLGKEKNCNISVNVNTNDVSNNLECERSAEATDILGDFCADFEYNNYYYNYSPYRTCNNSWKEKSSPVVSSDKGTPKSVSVARRGSGSRKLGAGSIRRSLSQNFLDSEVQSTSSTPEKQGSGDCASSSAVSPISVKCLSQDSIHLKSHNSPSKKEKHNLAQDNNLYGLPEVPLAQAVMNSVSCGQKKKSSGNRSLSSIKHMLEDSFVDELGSSAFWRENIGTPSNTGLKHCSTPKEIGTSNLTYEETPHSQGRVTNDVTPMPDYSGMKTPMLKRELYKYGLKPLKKRQAKLILRHIYDELHPYVEGGETTLSVKSAEIPEQSPVTATDTLKSKLSQRNTSESPSKAASVKSEENNDTSVSSSQGSCSSRSDFVVTEELTDEVGLTQMNPTDLKEAVQELIKNDESLHRKVLLYEPIWLEELNSALKEKKYKFKLEQIIEFLDEQCITFRTEQKRPIKKTKKKS